MPTVTRKFWVYIIGLFNKKSDTTGATPKLNFRKIQYLRLLDTILTAFPRMKVVWAHEGLSKELINLHPAVHSHIMGKLFEHHPNLYTDMLWDVIPKLYLMNYDNATDSIDTFKTTPHEDITHEAELCLGQN